MIPGRAEPLDAAKHLQQHDQQRWWNHKTAQETVLHAEVTWTSVTAATKTMRSLKKPSCLRAGASHSFSVAVPAGFVCQCQPDDFKYGFGISASDEQKSPSDTFPFPSLAKDAMAAFLLTSV